MSFPGYLMEDGSMIFSHREWNSILAHYGDETTALRSLGLSRDESAATGNYLNGDDITADDDDTSSQASGESHEYYGPVPPGFWESFADDAEQNGFAQTSETSHLPTWSTFTATHLDWPELPTLSDTDDCPICGLNFAENRAILIELPCEGKHQICLKCAREWFKPCPGKGDPEKVNACPMCREQLFQFGNQQFKMSLYRDEEFPDTSGGYVHEDLPDFSDVYLANDVRSIPDGYLADDELPDEELSEGDIPVDELTDQSLVWFVTNNEAPLAFVQHLPWLDLAFRLCLYEPPRYWSSRYQLRTDIDVRDPEIEAQEVTVEETFTAARILTNNMIKGYIEAITLRNDYGYLDMMMHPATVYAVLALVRFLARYGETFPLSGERYTLVGLGVELKRELMHSKIRERSFDTLPSFWHQNMREVIQAAVDGIYQDRCRNSQASEDLQTRTGEEQLFED